ncbi:MAG: ADP-heptose--LPS heptosyltransferase [Ignavibacteria bacterium RBG_13_36_8]|nr:MAG: ADP-heptose--LPS heptosyltransferase [Ignavibacteria bacterium RBG_13_36_8]
MALSGIGDALMFTPALIKLKENFPNVEIDALVMFKGAEDIYKRLAQVSAVHYYDFINSNPVAALRYLLRFRKKYNMTINVYPANRREYNLMSFIIGARKRAAVSYLRKNLLNFGFLNNVTIKENDNLHNVEENVKLCEKLINSPIDEIPDLQLNLTEEELLFGEKFLLEKNVSEKDIVIGFHPGCATFKNHIKRRWEPEKFIGLGKNLIKDFNAKILLFGGEDEEKLKSEIIEGINSSSAFSVRTKTLLQSAAVMKRCNVFVTNDSALMHIAAALKLKVIGIIGPTNKDYIYPWHTNHKLVSLNLDCSPCFYYSPKPLTCTRKDMKFKCIKNLSTNMVYKVVNEFLN